MKKILLFGGTTEGRLLSDMLTEGSIAHTVSVVSEYGSEMMKEDPERRVIVGRMDEAGMTEYMRAEGFGAEDICIDATHPYATEVSMNILNAAKAAGVKHIRVLRDEKHSDVNGSGITVCDGLEKCCELLKCSEGNILLTTGSKELHAYCSIMDKDTIDRTYVRVLPSRESIEICENEGIEAKHVIAAHGPFGYEFNAALIKQYDIRHLVTKDSGSRGGFEEKLKACTDAKINAYVIKRPDDLPGVDIYEAYRMIAGEGYRSRRRIFLAGCGMGEESTYTCELRTAIEQADAVFGASRLIKGIDTADKYAMYKAEDIAGVLKDRPEYKNVLILFSGDSGLYSGTASAVKYLREWDAGADIKILPGISSVAYLSALTGESYDDALISSIHGKDTPQDINALTEKIRYNRKTFVLLSGDKDIRLLAKALKEKEISAKILTGADMSYENEELITLDLKDAEGFERKGVLTALIINDGFIRRPLMPVCNDEDFIRDKVPMTKECIRHESLISMQLKEGDVVYDIGGGTGSVAIEAALLDPSLKVYTIEKKEEALSLIEQNIAKHHAVNVALIKGEAPQALADLEKPDSVFIGGSSGALMDIIDTIHAKGSGIRYVITAVSLETMEEIRSLTDKEGISDASCVQLQVNDIYKAGSHHLLRANNPVMLFAFTW